MLNTILDRFE